VLSALGHGRDSVEMRADYTHKVGGVHIRYAAGATYHKVPASVVRAIVSAQAGSIVNADR
jgi:hypothetical protein